MKKISVSYLFFCFFSYLQAQNISIPKQSIFSSSNKTLNLSDYKPNPVQLSEETICWLSEIKLSNSLEYIDHLISFSKKFLGVRYRYAGRSPYGFDCSGFTSFVYSKFGFSLSGSAPEQATIGFDIERTDAKKGDLIFFKGRNWRSRNIGHVGLVIANENGKITFIHASVCCGITVESTDIAYYATRFIKVSRISEPKS